MDADSAGRLTDLSVCWRDDDVTVVLKQVPCCKCVVLFVE